MLSLTKYEVAALALRQAQGEGFPEARRFPPPCLDASSYAYLNRGKSGRTRR